MKIEEVIKQLESILDHTRSMAASPDADDIWKEDIDALEFAITALRSMPEAREYHFRDATKMVPLTLGQLREMKGKPVLIRELANDKKYYAIIQLVSEVGVNLFDEEYGEDYGSLSLYGKTWLAYSYPQKWISVKNKKLLPKIKERVLSRLCYPDIGEVVVENQYYGNGMWMEETSAITHWMPLPEPPEEG